MRKVGTAVGEIGITVKFSKQRKWLHLTEKERTERTVVNNLMYADDMVMVASELESVKKYVVELD